MTRTSRLSSNFTLSPTKRLSILAPDSPRSRRQSIADTSRSENVFLDVPENNDEKEKKQRQLNRLQQQIQSKTYSPTAATTDPRKSISIVSGLSIQQLTEHYSKCLQLSTENKINVNNAFNLQLIDYMSEMLHRRDSEMENFQAASCTLDASAKIYAYRVDNVHTDALKIAGGLGRSKGDKAKNGPDHMDHQDDDDEKKGKKKRKRKKVIIESNVKNINVKRFDLDFQVDPLFKKMAAQFDEGRSTCGPFLTSLQFLDDSCGLILDSETVLLNSGKVVQEEPPQMPLVSVPCVPDTKDKMICPTFAPFEFTTWKLGDEDSFCDISRLRNTDEEDEATEAVDVHKFDVTAVPEPICEDMDFDNYNDDGIGGEEGDTVVTVGQEGCQKMPPPLMEAVHLKDHLATIPSEYSYFDSHRMCAWAGPTHWKIRPLSKTKLGETKNDKKRKKEFIKMTYKDEVSNITKLFAVDRKITKLSQATLKTWTKDKTTMPLDLHFEARNFFMLKSRPTIIIQRQRKAAAVDESINEYNYDNQNDRENFCAQDDTVSGYDGSTPGYDMTDIFSETAVGSHPMSEGMENDRENFCAQDDTVSGYDGSTPGYDMTDIFSETAVGSQPMSEGLENKTSDFLGNLVAAPDKVEKVNIGYARIAKKVDMKKLKAAIWEMLYHPTTGKENCKQSENQAENSKNDKMDTNSDMEFSSMYKILPQRLSKSMSGNISVPLVFIGLLHLANEHNLKLLDKGNLTDFTIMQG